MTLSTKIHESFAARANLHPSHPAILTDDGTLTCAELNSVADLLALELYKRGIGTQEAVGVLTERSSDLPAAFLAILKAGGVYVPMVADLPPDRLASIAGQAGIKIVIALDGIELPPSLLAALTINGADSHTGELSSVIRPEKVSKDKNVRNTSLLPSKKPGKMTDLAAILFTSGSTGMPKGVMLQHDACANMALGHIEAHGISSDDRILLSTSPGFILGFRELCLPFMSGATFVPVSRSTINNPDILLAKMAQHSVSIAMFTPSYLRLLKGAVPQGLRCIITAGEQPDAFDARHYAKHLEYWNVHGATEVCGTICMHRVDPDEQGVIPSGRPFANTSVYLLDDNGNEVKNGEVGEIHIVSVGVSRGYLNQPELSDKTFIKTRYGRAYRTYDLARWNKNGALETLGRTDDAIKISGQSVYPGEIESALQSHPNVRQAKVMQHKGLLIGCAECSESKQKVDWREFLGKTLPSYMIPAQIIELPKMPVNSAGKLDRKSLLKIIESALNNERIQKTDTEPRGELEVTIAAIWEDVIKFRPVPRDTNFFSLGGTSLMAIDVSSRLHKLGFNVPVQMMLTALTIKELARRCANQQKQSRLSRTPESEDIATMDQESFWLAAKIGMTPAASHIGRVLAIRGVVVNRNHWQSAWTQLLNHHAALRTLFYSKNEEAPLQWRTAEPRELLQHKNLIFDACSSLADAQKIALHWRNKKFDLSKAPLARAGLITVDDENLTLFWFVFHHAVVDGISARLIQDNLLALLGNRQLPPAPNGIAIASHTEQQYLASDRVAHDRKFWLNRFDTLIQRGSEAFDDQINDRQRPVVASGRGAESLIEHLDADTVQKLGHMAKRYGAGLHGLLLAILTAETRRRTGASDVIIGNGISVRPAGCETAVGHFVNLLPVILLHDGKEPFAEELRTTQSALTETVEHSAYPAAQLYREFRQQHPELRPSRPSLFDIALTAIPPRYSTDTETGITLAPQPLPGEPEHPAAGLDLLFSHEPCSEAVPGDNNDGNGGINLHLSWNPDVCSKKSAKAWIAGFAAWARWLSEKPERFEQPLPALLPHETKLIEQWETGQNQPRKNKFSHELFEAFAVQYPLRPAVVSREQVETYAQLNIRADKIATALRLHGVGKGTRVAVLTIGSSDLPATILGIWKAGGIYLPLAHELPAVRLAAMSKDADVSLLVVLDQLEVPKALAEAITTITRFEDCLTADPAVQNLIDSNSDSTNRDSYGEEIAYIIYTSGTTGMPKGVPVTHKGYINCILGVAEEVGLLPDDRMSMAATVGFDASLWELGMTLLNGIAIVPVSHMLRDDPWQLKRFYNELGVTIAFHTPSYLRISEQIPFKSLRILFTGGEAPNHRDVHFHANHLDFWNCYGPTETAIVASLTKLINKPNPTKPLSVGRPLPNVHFSLRHGDGSPVPPGVQGELWIGGMGVAHDYLNRPELSAERFVNLPDGRFYRSGDYGSWNAEGKLVINGRIDHQVKLNGQRVEPGEIEQILCTHPDVEDAIVLVEDLDSGMKVVRAFIYPKNPGSDNSATSETVLKDFLVERLPTHMLPAGITTIDKVPLTPAGKVDRMALLAFEKQRIKNDSGEAPQGRLEKRIAAIWSDVLGFKVTRHDNFFALGGNSLLAVRVAHQISEELNQYITARSLFATPTLAGFVNSIKSQPNRDKPLKINTEPDHASEGEKEFWIAETAGLDTRTFTIPVHCIVMGNVDHDSWQKAWSTLVSRHEALSTFFTKNENGELIRKSASPITDSLEFTTMPCKADALAYIRRRQRESLPMDAAPLWRAGLVKIKAVETDVQKTHFFWLALHHSIGDGQSVNTLLNEFNTLLDNKTLPPAGESVRGLAAREQAYLASKDAASDAEYWNDMLRQVPVAAFREWPLDKARSPLTPTGNHRLEILFDSQTSRKLKVLAREHNATLHSVMLTLLAMETRRRTGRCDILIGTTASIRESASDAQIVGYGVNMLPLHLVCSEEKSFGDLIKRTQETLARALQHARYPFSRICRTFWNEQPELRHPQRYPLFDIAITENPGRGDSKTEKNDSPQRFMQISGATENVGYERTKVSPGQDMVLIHESLDSGEILLKLHVNAAVYTAETSQNWVESIAGWVRWITKEKSRADNPLPRLLPEEQVLLAELEYGKRIQRPGLRYHELFETVVDRQGQADLPAVVTHNETISYKALDAKANTIAHALVTHGVNHGDVVAVISGRSPQLPAAALGIWKAGAVYLPLAFDLPPERLAFIARDAGVSHIIALDGVSVPELLTHDRPVAIRPEDFSEKFCRENRKRITGNNNTKDCSFGKPDDVAYILYTSGSTGEPKGTLIGHDSYVNLVLSAVETYDLTNADHCLMFASPSFDVSLSDIGIPLACGASIYPVPDKTIESPNRFLKFLQDMSITLADITPTYLRLFEGEQLPSSLRILVTGGEPPVFEDARKYADQLDYYNAYGPTENTITSCMGTIKSNSQAPLSAGRPFPNTSLHICDANGDPLPPGVMGEIWLGGAGLGKGYLNRPELMQAVFVTPPGGRRYRTGDLGRWRRDKTVEIAGRIDDQVKLNGIRIEPGEIEYALAGHEEVSQAVTLLAMQDGGKKSLWGFVRLSKGAKSPSDSEWRAYLSKKLPSHMIPSGIIQVSAIPVSTSGKVDKSALHGLLPESASSEALTQPQNDLERSVAEVWSAVLKINPIHREDNFFSLGGHSLMAIEVAYRLEKKLGYEVPARELFIEPTLSGFAERLAELLRVNSFNKIMTDSVSNRATAGQQEFWTAEQAEFDMRGFNISLTLAVQGDVPSSRCWLEAWDKLLLRHDALRTGFREDESGILRREVSTQLETKFKIETASSSAQAKATIKAWQSEPFAMGVAGLWRAGLTRITDSGQSIFWFVMHHAVGDGLSLGILIDELLALLKNKSLAPSVNNFDKVAAIEKSYLAGKSAQTDSVYWQKLLENLAEKSPDAFDEWPLDKPRPHARNTSSIKGSHCFCTCLDPVASDGLRALAQKNEATLHALMLTIVGLEVHRRTGRSGFLLGTAASTRKSAAEAEVIGYFVNMLPLIFSSRDDRSIHSALRAMQQGLAQALQHSGYPFARIYDDFRKQRPHPTHPARYPLFDIAVTENPAIRVSPKNGLHFTGLDTTILKSTAQASNSIVEPVSGNTNYELRNNAPAQDMVLIHEEQPDKGLALTWYVNAAVYTKESAQIWFDSLISWLTFFGKKSQTEKSLIPRLLPVEKRLLKNWQNGPVLPLPVESFPDLFRQITKDHPQNPAIVTDAGVQSFSEINTGSDALANVLLKHNLKRGDAVGVFTERSAALPETVLAIWKAGGCYLPLTSDLPVERLSFMSKDAGIKILIVLDGLFLPPELEKKNCIIRPEKLHEGKTPAVITQKNISAEVAIASDDLAYIIYTSGSTGVPKGVVLNHGGMLNLGLGGVKGLGLKSSDRALLMASPSFDLWISDLVMAWAVGAALVPVRRDDMNDILGMRAMLIRLGVTVATMSPSYLRLFEKADLPGIRILMTVGEPPVVEDIEHYASKLSYFNGYGPTENTAAASFSHVQNVKQITAGKPISNSEITIVDENGNLVPPGVIGEVWLSGIGLAVGYLNRPDLTEKAFVNNNGKRRYRTGDLGRWLPNGDLQIFGRLDSQIKLRSQRVEPGEIEHCLSSYPGVLRAVVLTKKLPDNTRVLRACFTMEENLAEPTQAEWGLFLSTSLPSYMIPSTILRVDSIPLTAAGKINSRELLLTMEKNVSREILMASEGQNQTPGTPPQNAIEKRIAAVWAEQIRCSRVAREDNFFELGGDSLRAIAVVGQLSREFKCRVNTLYENPVLVDFAAACQPRRAHLRDVLDISSGVHSKAMIRNMTRAGEKAETEQSLINQRNLYEKRLSSDLKRDLEIRHNYRHVLLTGATGYLGSYLLRELMADPAIKVTIIVRGKNNQLAGARVGQVLSHYFGSAAGKALCDDKRLNTLAGDLRSEQLQLPPQVYSKLAASVDAIYHCAANVNHIGHYEDFHTGNVTATRHLLSLAALKKPEPADFHFISTLSVSGGSLTPEYQLFTEYDTAPKKPDDNYYIRTKQEAEHLVIAARNMLANASIHRIGNITFATESDYLQQNIEQNAFFRQLVSFIQLGAVPTELPASLSHVDIVTKAVIALGGSKNLTNDIHHIETARQDRLADFICSGDGMAERVVACDFGTFLERLKKAIDEPAMESAVTETVETFGLQSGRAVFTEPERLCVVSDRTQALLNKLGILWPEIPFSGQNAMLQKAMEISKNSLQQSVKPVQADMIWRSK